MKRKTSAEQPAPLADKRVLIVDDHPFLRMGLTESLVREPGLSVCGAVGTAEEALSAMENLQPDVVVTDLNLPGKSGIELIKDLAAIRPGLPVLALSMHDEEIYAERCLRAGARGYVMKNEGPEKLAAAIRHVLAGGTHVSATTSARILDTFIGRANNKNSPVSGLSDREFDVFQWMGRGLSTHEIANRMHISPKTVETHRMHIKTKLKIGSVTELVAYASRWVGSTT
jgi:DNA-binding NarL/FixJ family response regulator